ncbi:hypothetical protein GCM10010317_039780 [Streptomyces mirabilis]|nr:hypothetical protein [Streptomyces mirabilis]GHD55089.1 hypothetical protein GCM10010317_039780 [Streptomyces mirabilis]
MTSEAGAISAEARRALEQELADLHVERGAVAATLGGATVTVRSLGAP